MPFILEYLEPLLLIGGHFLEREVVVNRETTFFRFVVVAIVARVLERRLVMSNLSLRCLLVCASGSEGRRIVPFSRNERKVLAVEPFETRSVQQL